MFDQGNTNLSVLVDKLRTAMQDIVAQGSQFYVLHAEVRKIAPDYEEFIVWSPELRGDQAVVDIWDRSWKPLATVSVQVSQEIQNAPIW